MVPTETNDSPELRQLVELVGIAPDDADEYLDLLASNFAAWRRVDSSDPSDATSATPISMDSLACAVVRYDRAVQRISFLPVNLREQELARLTSDLDVSIDDFLMINRWWSQSGRRVRLGDHN